VFGEQGHPVRATISEMGPLLLARLFELNDTQSAVLSLVFKIADDNNILLLDLKDLQAMLQYVGTMPPSTRPPMATFLPPALVRSSAVS
jgi:DNA helicase HerA-like ATPase